jgi:DNA-binding Lrp family transcriptional regulator
VRAAGEELTEQIEGRPSRGPWTFFTNHLHVLVCIAADPTIRLRDVANLVGITERAAQSIVADLVDEGYVTRIRVGRRNQYRVHPSKPLRHPLEEHQTVGGLLDFLAPIMVETSRNGTSARRRSS